MNETSLVKMSPEGIKKFLHIFNKFLEGFELDEYETNVFPATSNAHSYKKIAWEKLPNFVKTSNTDFTLVTNVYIKRL